MRSTLSSNSKLLFRTVLGILLWLAGLAFLYGALNQLFAGADFWIWLGHVGQGLVAVLIGFALMPYSSVSEFLENTFYSKR